MKYGPDLKTFLKAPSSTEFKENTIKGIKNTHLGKLKYNPKLEIKVTQEEPNEIKTEKIIKKEKSLVSLNSFQLAKQLNETVEKNEQVFFELKPEKIENHKVLDELVVQTSKYNVEKYFKELDESDNKILQEKHRHHVQMFEKFRTSPKIIKETSKELNIQPIEPIQEKQLAPTEIKKTLTPLEIEQKIMNDKTALELFQYEKNLIELLNMFAILLERIQKTGINRFETNLIEKCKSRLKDHQSMIDNKILQKLKLLFRMNLYEKEVKNFLDEYKKMEILYKTEITDIDNKINEQNKIIEAEKLAKLEKHKKAVESFIKEVESYSNKMKNLENIFKTINTTMLNINKNHEKFNADFINNLEKSINEIEKIINVDLKEILSDKLKINNQTEENFKIILNNFKTQYDFYLNNAKNYETKLNEQMKIIAEAAAAKPVPPPPTTTADLRPLSTLTTTKPPPQPTTTAPSTAITSTLTTQPQNSPSITAQSGPVDSFKTYVMPHSSENYNQSINLIKLMQKEFETIFSATQFKSYKYELQNAINFPLNSLLEDNTNADNKRNFHDKIKTLLRLFNGETCVITSVLTVNPTKHPKAIEFCMDYLARKLVEKGEKTVSSRPETAFQYVQLAISIIKQYPTFKNILVAYFYEKCPYTVPFYKQKLANQTIEDYFESLGYKIDEGKVEEDEYFFKRMTGILYLYFTLLIHPDYKDGIKQSWIWLSDILNMKPRPNITAHALAIFFKCCGYQLHKIYRQQFTKMVSLCIKQYLPHLKSMKDESQNKAFLGRLELTLSEYEKYGHFSEWKK